ncbi:hypothetical protein [Polaromonas sp.]|uniref:hypothetical protein n=1 Tax=Polaromonas sp. TaxID=1869339 RepID=UPI00352B30D5
MSSTDPDVNARIQPIFHDQIPDHVTDVEAWATKNRADAERVQQCWNPEVNEQQKRNAGRVAEQYTKLLNTYLLGAKLEESLAPKASVKSAARAIK